MRWPLNLGPSASSAHHPPRSAVGLVRVWPGSPYPLGASWDGEGVNFALFSEHAEAVTLLLFEDPCSGVPSDVISLTEKTDQVWHVYLPTSGPGRCTATRSTDPTSQAPGTASTPTNSSSIRTPRRGAARRLERRLFGYTVGDPARISRSTRATPPAPPQVRRGRSVVHLAGRPAATHAVEPHRHLRDTRARHDDAASRGARAPARHIPGLASDPIVDHLLNLGVTAVELMPVHHFVADRN